MILTNAQIYDSIAALSQAKDEKGLLGYAVAVNIRKLTAMPEAAEFTKKRDELLPQFGKEIGDGQYTLTRAAAAAYQEALQPYAEIQTDVAVMQVAPEVFYGGGLTSSQMFTLSWMVKEG